MHQKPPKPLLILVLKQKLALKIQNKNVNIMLNFSTMRNILPYLRHIFA